MARVTGQHLMTVRQVLAAGEGDHLDGGNLLLRVRGDSASWVFRYTAPSGKRREMGLGAVIRGDLAQAEKSLVGARDLAHEKRELLRKGQDPLDAKQASRQAAAAAAATKKAEKSRERLTLARVARDYHARVIEPTKTTKHAADWINSLENHLPPSLWHKPIAEIEPPELLQALVGVKAHERSRRVEVGSRVSETVKRIRQRLDAIFEDAIFYKRATSNPAAAILRKMRDELPAPKEGRFAALAYKDAPALMDRIRAMQGTAARCLEFAVLTAARTREALLAEWSEIDLEAGTWLLPASRMKAKGEHLVHLSPRALEIVKAQAGQDDRYVFPTLMPDRQGKPLSTMAMLVALGRLGVRDKTTVHGLCRATFSTWAYETAAARPDVIEACLAHKEADKVKRAYNRATFNHERAELLSKWSTFLAGAQVIEFKRAAV